MIAGDELYQRLMAMRAPTIGRYRGRYPNVPEQQLEDLYSGVLEMAWTHIPALEFEVGRQIQRWVNDRLQEAVSNYMRRSEYAAREWRDTSEIVERHQARDDSPDEVAQIREDHLTLYEYIAELSESDRRIALLYLHPESRLPAKKIAALENIPYDDAKTILKRLRANFSYYEARLVGPASICARRRKDLSRWQKTGEMPFALSWHIKRCATCAVACHHARGEVVGALMPFMPAAGMPTLAGGLLVRIHHHLAGHKLVVKTMKAASKVSRLASSNGGGMAIVGGKVVIVAAVMSTAATAGAVGVVRAVTTAHHHRPAVRHVAALTPSRGTPVSTPSSAPGPNKFAPKALVKVAPKKPATKRHKRTRRPAEKHDTTVVKAFKHQSTALTPTTTSITPTPQAPAATTTASTPPAATATTPPAPNTDNAPVSPSMGGASSARSSGSTSRSGGSAGAVAPNGPTATAP